MMAAPVCVHLRASAAHPPDRREMPSAFVRAIRGGRRSSRSTIRRVAAALARGALLPRPAAVDLRLEREAQEGADDDDEAEHAEVLERRLHRHRADDVRGDEELEAEQDRAAEVEAVRRVGELEAAAAQAREEADRREQRAEDDDRDPADLDRADEQVDVLEEHGPRPLGSERRTARTDPDMRPAA